jgi:signal transduction histidine kinase
VSVTVHAGVAPDDHIVLVIDDRPTVAQPAGPGPGQAQGLAATGGGYGVRGMRERAELLGGTLSAGVLDGGWRVELRLPAPEAKAGGESR